MGTFEVVAVWVIGGVGGGIFCWSDIDGIWLVYWRLLLYRSLGRGVGDIRGLFPRAGMFSYLVMVVGGYAGDCSVQESGKEL